mmetsp:Transcript_4209/g.7141  ORF Transcript_4209/g.7141 Transcript_4209/m.7141 type:complete len:95 (+) Transcript_4209:260-544(+)
MHSLITQYAVEGNDNGKPNGSFFLTKDAARAVSNEVVLTHLGMDGNKRKSFVASRFNKVWNHIDVLHDGYLEVEKMPQFLRMLVGEVEASVGLQ